MRSINFIGIFLVFRFPKLQQSFFVILNSVRGLKLPWSRA